MFISARIFLFLFSFLKSPQGSDILPDISLFCLPLSHLLDSTLFHLLSRICWVCVWRVFADELSSLYPTSIPTWKGKQAALCYHHLTTVQQIKSVLRCHHSCKKTSENIYCKAKCSVGDMQRINHPAPATAVSLLWGWVALIPACCAPCLLWKGMWGQRQGEGQEPWGCQCPCGRSRRCWGAGSDPATQHSTPALLLLKSSKTGALHSFL